MNHWRDQYDAETLRKFDALLAEHAPHAGSLITILQGAQALFGYLSREVMGEIAQATGSTIAKVMGVATFYTQFRFAPVGKYLIMLCKGTACHVNGSDAIGATITETLGIRDGETTADGLFSLVHVACLGCCSLSPVMMINDNAYGSLTPDKVKRILADIRAGEAV